MEDFLPIIPAFIVYSGSGIQLHFLFDEEYKIYHNQYVYKYLVKQMNMEIYEYLTKKGIKIGKIDTLTCNSVCRMPYTWNNRAKDYSRILVINEDRIEQKRRPSFDMMLFLFKIKPPKEYIKGEKKQRLTSKQVYSNSTITRFEKFYKINIDCFKPGYRNKALYALAYSIAAICHCKDMLKHIIYNINYMLPKPLEMAEVEVIIRSAISHSEKGHPYGLISQIRWIGLNPFSMKSTELLFSSTPEERKESHAIASHKYSIKQLRKRWKAKSKLIIEVAECFKKKQNKTEVAETMHLSRKTVIKYVRIMTEITEAKAKNSINSIYYFFQKYGISKVKSVSPEKQIGVPYSKCVKSADTITGTDKIVDLKGTYSTTNLSNRVLLC